jgi:hypothetical protein
MIAASRLSRCALRRDDSTKGSIRITRYAFGNGNASARLFLTWNQ